MLLKTKIAMSCGCVVIVRTRRSLTTTQLTPCVKHDKREQFDERTEIIQQAKEMASED